MSGIDMTVLNKLPAITKISTKKYNWLRDKARKDLQAEILCAKLISHINAYNESAKNLDLLYNQCVSSNIVDDLPWDTD